MSENKNDTIGQTIAKSSAGSLFRGLFHSTGKFIADTLTGKSEGKRTGKPNNELDSDFEVQLNGIQNRILREGMAEFKIDKKSGKGYFLFNKNAEMTGEQLEYILTGKDYKKGEEVK